MIKVVELNKNGKIELTKEEFEKALNESYSQGYFDGYMAVDHIRYPSNVPDINPQPYTPYDPIYDPYHITCKNGKIEITNSKV